MVKRAVRVRFAPVKTAPPPPTRHGETSTVVNFCDEVQQRNISTSSKRGRSRQGCRECRQRKVKCDEEFPTCRRCRQRGSICLSDPPTCGWKFELPWIFAHASGESSASTAQISGAKSSLMQWWFDKVCHIMVLDPHVNPLSYPILEHVTASPALFHTIQSISAAHQQYFTTELTTCFYERSLAIRLLKGTLDNQRMPLISLFFTIYMLGVSSSWVDNTFQDYGREHLLGARAVLDKLICNYDTKTDSTVKILIGYYLFWDMSVSLLSEPHLLPPIDTPELSGIVENMHDFLHPLVGYSAKLFYLLGVIGRYFRTVLDGGQRDVIIERLTGEKLISWEGRECHRDDLRQFDAFRKQGLVLLHQIKLLHPIPGYDEEHLILEEMQQYARECVQVLLSVPETENYFIVHANPLTLAASVLPAQDSEARSQTLIRLQAMFSFCRARTMIGAMTLLEELWELNDSGIQVTYVELMLRKRWNVCLV